MSDDGTMGLLTRAADAAGKAAGRADDEIPEESTWRRFVAVVVKSFMLREHGVRLLAASGPDHWRAVEGLLRAMVGMHWREAEGLCDMCIEPFPCPTLQALRPLAEQVLRDLRDGS